MYIPKINKINDKDEIFRFIRENPFAIIISNNNDEITATHTPVELLVKPDGSAVLRTHIAKANPQWKNFTDATELMVIFNGPHTYISSSWYNHINVPTWNYIAIHVYGKPKILNREETIGLLNDLVTRFEQHSEKPFSMQQLDITYLDNHLKALVAFEIEIERIDAKEKLSQNRDAHNFKLVIDHLDSRQDEQSKAIQAEMNRIKKKLFE